MGMPMGPLGIFILAFLLYITHGIYLGGFIRAFKRCFGEITGYWIAMSIFTLIFAALITIVYPASTSSTGAFRLITSLFSSP
ncbi:hypothetical protein [Thermococcus sp.]|uniref:hypothetical protein n=1 Tax=Thermococcus sp. TaxID=35749 RepID=UPI0025D6290E|nr:hypothetical protein [Thermococcus sp.]